MFPQAAMNVRCALDEPRYTGVKPPDKNVYPKSISTKSIEEISPILDESGVELYPNPNNGIFTIKLGKFVQGNIQIVNMNGNLIYSKEFHNQSEIEVDIESQPSGIYLIKIVSGKEEVKKKVIKK